MNWIEYINHALFGVELKLEHIDANLFKYCLKNGTEIDVYLSDDRMTIYDILYWNRISTSESGEFKHYLGDGFFSEKNKLIVREILLVPLIMGSTDDHSSYNSNWLKINRYYGIGSKREKKVSYKFSFSFFTRILTPSSKTKKNIIEIFPPESTSV